MSRAAARAATSPGPASHARAAGPERVGTPHPEPPAGARARLRDGSTVTIRALVPGDEAALRSFLEGLGVEAKRLRFFTGAVDLGHIAREIAATGPDRLGLLALDEGGAVVGHALAARLGSPQRSEVAVEVADRLHGQGLGTILIERLARLAETAGITTFVARVLGDNQPMLDVFHDGFDARTRWDDGEERVEFPTSAWRLARERFG